MVLRLTMLQGYWNRALRLIAQSTKVMLRGVVTPLGVPNPVLPYLRAHFFTAGYC